MTSPPFRPAPSSAALRRVDIVAGGDDDERAPRRGTIIPDGGVDVMSPPKSRSRTRPKKPSLYKVLLHNDDFTPMAFVVRVLQSFFGKERAEAVRIMLKVHHDGIGICGVYPYEVAETKASMTLDAARSREYPLKCTLEKD